MADINLGQLTEAINDKADRDLNNVEQSDVMKKIFFPTPDFSREVQIATAGNGFNYVANENGVLIGNIDGSAAQHITVNGFIGVVGGNDSGNEGPFYLPVCKGDLCVSVTSTRGTWFVPYKYVEK